MDGLPVDKAGAQIDPDAQVRLREGDHGYVSRGAVKLEAALDHFAIDPTGAIALDIGASTGGFTDLLLRRGAARVYAVDVGYGQLAWSLRQDPRVVVLERENVRYLDPAKIPEPCDLAVVDVTPPTRTLKLRVRGTGTGRIVSTPAALDCRASCSAQAPANAGVTLRVTPDPGSVFKGWGGACSGTAPTCTVQMTQNVSVTVKLGRA